MSDPIQLLATTVEISDTLAAGKTITGITAANPPVISCVGHGFNDGDVVLIDAVVGMTQINKYPVRVDNKTTDSFEAEGLDASGFSAYVSGGTASKPTGWLAFDTLTTFNFPEPQPNPQPVTTIHDTSEREIFGLDSAPSCTADAHAQPLNTTIQRVRQVAKGKLDAICRAKFQNGNVLLVNAKWAGGRGIDGSAGEVAKSQISLRFVKDEQWFAS